MNTKNLIHPSSIILYFRQSEFVECAKAAVYKNLVSVLNISCTIPSLQILELPLPFCESKDSIRASFNLALESLIKFARQPQKFGCM